MKLCGIKGQLCSQCVNGCQAQQAQCAEPVDVPSPHIGRVLSSGLGKPLPDVTRLWDDGCCHKTRVRGAPCPIGRTCPHDKPPFPRDKLDQDLIKLLAERGSRYGAFKDMAIVAQNIKRAMMNSANWQTLSYDQREAMEMIAHKASRILNGDPDYADSWDDISGYAKLVADRLNGKVQ